MITATINQPQQIKAEIKTQTLSAQIQLGGQTDYRVDYQTTDFATLLKLQTGITYENTN